MSLTPPNFKIEPAAVWKRWRNTAIVLLALAALVVCSPILLPLSALTRVRHRRRIRRAARAFTCPACGRPLGDASLPLAEQHWNAALAEYQRKNPGLRFNFPRPYDAACPHCPAHYTFNRQSRSFQPVSASL